MRLAANAKSAEQRIEQGVVLRSMHVGQVCHIFDRKALGFEMFGVKCDVLGSAI